MTDYDDLDMYNGDTEHDMWVDFDSYVIGLPLCSGKENTGSPDVFFAGEKRQVGYDELDYDNNIDDLNDWD